MIKNYRKLFPLILALGLLLPVFDAQASSFWGGIASFGSEAVKNLFSYSLFWVFSILGKVLAVIVSMLDWVVKIRIYTDLPIIQSGWKIMRDFANMLFIIALIVMAYGTIFNIPKYNFRSLIGRFIVIAVLINFSLVLGGLMIDATQVLNNTFLNAMGDISGRLGDGLKPADLLPATAQIGDFGTVVDVGGASIVTLFFGIFFLFAFIISVAVPLAVAFVRIPVLWALLIVSPMAWFLSILPATKGAYDKWWHQFLSWNLFLPYYLFFLYFALFFLSQQSVVLEGMLRGPAGQAIVNEDFRKFGIQNSVTFGLLFYYILVAIFLIGGTKVAMSAGTFSGTGIVNVAKWGRGKTITALRRTPLPYLGSYEATSRAAQQRLEQFQKEGFKGRFGQKLYGGERGLELETARRGRLFGVKGALEKGVEIEREKQKPFANNVGRLQELAKGGSREQMLAARTRLAELGDQDFLTKERINETLQMSGGERSELGNKYLAGIDNAKLTEATRKWVSETIKNVEVLKKNAIAMIEKDKLDKNEIERLSRQFLNETDKKEFLNKGYKKNLLAAAEARMELGLSEAKNIGDEVEKALGKMSEDQIIETMSDPGFKDTYNKTPTIKNAFNSVLVKNPKKLQNLVAKASGDAHGILSDMVEPARQEQVEQQTATLRPKKEALERKIAAAEQERTALLGRIDPLKNYPTSDDYKQAQRELESKETEIKSLQTKAEKIDERIEDIEIKTRGS